MTINKKDEQYVYVMSNTSFDDDVFKIGWTREHPVIRANNLHTSGLPTPFAVEYVITTTEGAKLEKNIHTRLKQFRMNNNREFFKISKNDLCEILTTELQLILTSISELDAPTNKPKSSKMKSIYELQRLHETLQQTYDDFTIKFKVENTLFHVTDVPDMNNKYHVTILKTEDRLTYNCLTAGYWDDNADYIKKELYFIQRYINNTKDDIDNVTCNYDEIKRRIGIKTLRSDNKYIKELILDTGKQLEDLKNKYIWDI